MTSHATGHTGISYNTERRKYVAQATRQKRTYYIGQFDTLEEAIERMNETEQKLPPRVVRERVQTDSDRARLVGAKAKRLFAAGWSTDEIAKAATVGRQRLVWVMESTPGQHILLDTLVKLDSQLDRLIDGTPTDEDETVNRNRDALKAYMKQRARRLAREKAYA